MNVFKNIVYVIGRVTPDGVRMLGSGFLVRPDGFVVTTHHVTGGNDVNLVVLMPREGTIDDYQDLSDTVCRHTPAKIVEVDPIRDLALLKVDIKLTGGVLPPLTGLDSMAIGEDVGIFGFPHCVDGRRALTYQRTEVGAKVLSESAGIKSKHAVINTQARPGQSGSLVFSAKSQSITGVLIGAWVPGAGGIILGNINPHELHQTTHCVSAEYIKDMLG